MAWKGNIYDQDFLLLGLLKFYFKAWKTKTYYGFKILYIGVVLMEMLVSIDKPIQYVK